MCSASAVRRLAVVSFISSAIEAASPPTFGPVMTAPFSQTITILGFQWSNEVGFWYDSTTKPVGSSLYNHGQGQHDEICTSVKGKEFFSGPCQLLASNDTWRYVIFPTSSPPLCCRVCNTTEYCGIIRPDWLQQNSTYQGTKTYNGETCYGWMKEGGEQNYYWAQADGTPCQYYEGYPTFQVGNNTWNFNFAGFSRSAIPASTFTVPAGLGCEAMCDTSELSYRERLEGAFRRAQV